jgi:hypothetical protein
MAPLCGIGKVTLTDCVAEDVYGAWEAGMSARQRSQVRHLPVGGQEGTELADSLVEGVTGHLATVDGKTLA